MTRPTDDVDPAAARRNRLRVIGLIVGFAMLAAAVAFVLRERATVEQALQSIRSANIFLALLVPITVLGNIVLTALLIRRLLSRFGRIGVCEMLALIAAASLFNYLPMRPGLVGRMGYHKKYHGIKLRDSFRAMLEAVALGGLCTAWVLGAAGISFFSRTAFVVVALAPIAILPLAAVLARGMISLWCEAALYRYLDLLVTAVRYHIVFELIGSPIDAPTAAVLAGISITATLIPFLSNGIGLREWLVGLFAPLLESGEAVNQTIAITADLVNRSAELVVVLIAGLIAFSYLAHRVASGRARQQTPAGSATSAP